MRKHTQQNQHNFPNFILVDETLYQRFAEFCKTFGTRPILDDCHKPFLTDPNQHITELPETFSNFILIDNQTGRVIR